jgi:cysteine desulfurase/selenocysteine lyase
MNYDVDLYRADFPILSGKMRGKPFTYLDSGATALKPQPVIEAEMEYYRDYGVNIHRGVYEYSERATRLHAATRDRVARLIGARESAEVIFTAGTTESVNLVAYGWGRKFLKPGDTVLTTDLEHHSSIVPWQAACEKTGARLDFIPLDPTSGELDLSGLDAQLAKGVKLVAITAMSNVSGYMPPLEAIIAAAHRHGALVLVDGAQYVSHHAIDVQKLDCDFLAFSAHKMLGPTGVGVLWGKRSVLSTMDPFLYGGDMIMEVRRTSSTYQDIPERFEAGTPNIAGIIAFSAAIDYLERVGLDRIALWEKGLLAHAVELAEDYPFIGRYGPADLSRCGGVFSFNAKGVHSHDIGTILDSQGIAVRTGFHCAMPYMEQLGTSGTVRASFYLYTKPEEIDRLFAATEMAWRMFS